MFPADAKILIVDDSGFARTMLKNQLRELSFSNILEAGDGATARGLLSKDEQKPVHLLICDIHMPEMTGLELLKWVRAHETLKALPVILVTSSQEKSEIFEAGRLGVSHYLVKPFEVKVLKEKLTSAWQKLQK